MGAHEHRLRGAPIARTPTIYGRTRNIGEMRARLVAPGKGEAVLTKYPRITLRDVRSLAVGLGCVMRLTGRKDVRVTGTPQGDGAVFHIAWRG